MGKFKPARNELNESTGEVERITYPDAQTLEIRGLQESGLTIVQIADKTGLSESTINRELKLFKDTIGRVFNPDSIRSELQAYIGLAKSDITQGMAKGTGTIGLRFLEGMGVLSQKLQIGQDKSSMPPESQVAELCGQLAQVPAYRLIMLEALGLSEPPEPIDLGEASVIEDSSTPVSGGG